MRNPQFIQDAQKNFDKAEERFNQLLSFTELEENIKEINLVKEASETYKKAMNDMLSNWLALQELEKKRMDFAEQVLKDAQEIAVNGISETEKIAQKTFSSLSSASVIIIAGLIISIFLGGCLAFFITRGITVPMRKSVAFAKSVAQGNLKATIDIDQKDEMGDLANALKDMKKRINDVLKETNRLIQAVQDGNLTSKGDSEKFDGGWQELIIGVNDLIDAFVKPINLTGIYLDRISKGDIPEKITEESKGDFNQIKNNLNILIDATLDITMIAENMAAGKLVTEIKARSEQDKLMMALSTMKERISNVLKEINCLIGNVQDGKLDVRGNEKGFSGGWRELVIGINNLIDAFVNPINTTAAYLDRLSKGEIPEKMTEEYKGDFNHIRNNLNMLIHTTYEITQLAEKMAKGDLTVEVKERSGQDILMRSLNMMINQLNEVVLNVKSVADNVVSGSSELSSASAEMSQGASQQASSAEQASASMEQMAANIRQNADNSTQTEKIALKAAEDAQNGGKAVSDTVLAMKEIKKRISVIEEIARQTNLLALNAAIEAARRGIRQGICCCCV